jgi:PadR family transcriptional regulator AphA
MTARLGNELLLGEWACLGIIAQRPVHGFAVAARLRPDGDVGAVWSLSRALTYRAIAQLEARGLVRPVGTEPGRAGGDRTVLAVTADGRRQLQRWLAAPVLHLRDLRSELLLKLTLCEQLRRSPRRLLAAQRTVIEPLVRVQAGDSAVDQWRAEMAEASLRFVDRRLALCR